MSQRGDNHPYMSKSQLNDYLTSLRTSKRDSYSKQPASQGQGSTPLVRALREKYGSGNTSARYVDVGLKRAESPSKRALPPLPGHKTEISTGWKAGQTKHDSAPAPPRREEMTQRRQERSPERREERSPEQRDVSAPREQSSSPAQRGDFWTTGVVPNIVVPVNAPSVEKQRPLPRDPREDLYLPRVEDLSISDPSPPTPSINVPSINAPSISVPAINAPSISVPSDPFPPEPASEIEKSWPSVHLRTKSSPALLCSVCSKPIAGRIVTAIGHRFHPECFRCATCSTELVGPQILPRKLSFIALGLFVCHPF
jgi:hypothetical protein